jgi:hypothetical protein
MKAITFSTLLVVSVFILATSFADIPHTATSPVALAQPNATCTPAEKVPDKNPYHEPSGDDLLDGPLGSPDIDCDGVQNSRDNCLLTYNPSQADKDGNRVGDVCEPDPYARSVRFLNCDDDGDGIIDEVDNCPIVCNPAQTNLNGNRIGDACDPGVPKAVMTFQRCSKTIAVKLPLWLHRKLIKR